MNVHVWEMVAGALAYTARALCCYVTPDCLLGCNGASDVVRVLCNRLLQAAKFARNSHLQIRLAQYQKQLSVERSTCLLIMASSEQLSCRELDAPRLLFNGVAPFFSLNHLLHHDSVSVTLKNATHPSCEPALPWPCPPPHGASPSANLRRGCARAPRCSRNAAARSEAAFR
jgi:hypothetical protein